MARKLTTPTHPEDAVVKLDTITLMRLRTVDAETSSLLAQVRALSIEIDVEISRNPKLKELTDARFSLNVALGEKRGQLKGIHHEIESKYGINLSECSVDDETGRVHQHAIPKSVPPLAEKPKASRKKKA